MVRSYHTQSLITDPLERALTTLWNAAVGVEVAVGDLVGVTDVDHNSDDLDIE